MTVTKSEQEELLNAAKDLGIPFEERPGPLVEGKVRFEHPFYDFGQLGAYRVAAIRSKMGALDYGGSAASALVYRSVTRATGIIAVGMAFGISDTNQKIGDVLVSEGLFPYDDRDVVPAGVEQKRAGKGPLWRLLSILRPAIRWVGAAWRSRSPWVPPPSESGGWAYRYDDIDPETGLIRGPAKRAKFRKAKASLVRFFQRHAKSTAGFNVHFGALLSGNARVHCRAYRDMLYNHLSSRGQAIVGGEMEAVGLLSCSDPQAPWWIVVKGICDFGDEKRDEIIATSRQAPCRNAARFVLDALRKSTATDKL